jgi:hypothetical protein
MGMDWLAGWLEGEGSFISTTTRGGSCATRVCATSTDLDVVQRAQRVAGGTVRGPVLREGCKPIYQWNVAARREAVALMLLLRPLMGERRTAQIDAAVAHDSEFPLRNPVAVCGTRSKYVRGCRCRACKDACAEAARDRRAKERIHG